MFDPKPLRRFLVSLAAGAPDCDEPRVLRALADRVLRSVRGGRIAEVTEAEDLVQDFLLRILALRTRHAGLSTELEQMADHALAAWVRRTMRNLAVEANPYWDTYRALGAMVRQTVERGLPPALGKPVSLERNGRFERAMVAAACAEVRESRPSIDCRQLTSFLMSEYGLGAIFVREEFASPGEVAQPQEEVSVAQRCHELRTLVGTVIAETTPEERRMLALRGEGFECMASAFGVALSTVHRRFDKLLAKLGTIARRLGVGRDAMADALQVVSVSA